MDESGGDAYEAMFGMLVVAGALIGGTSASSHSTLQSSQPQQQQQQSPRQDSQSTGTAGVAGATVEKIADNPAS